MSSTDMRQIMSQLNMIAESDKPKEFDPIVVINNGIKYTAKMSFDDATDTFNVKYFRAGKLLPVVTRHTSYDVVRMEARKELEQIAMDDSDGMVAPTTDTRQTDMFGESK